MVESALERSRRNPPLRRASDRTPLGNILGRIEYAYGTGDREWAAELIDREPLAAWFGFPPERLREMILAFTDDEIAFGGFLQVVSGMLGAREKAAETVFPGSAVDAAPGDDMAELESGSEMSGASLENAAPGANSASGTNKASGESDAAGESGNENLDRAAESFMLRLEGRPAEAYQSELELQLGIQQQLFDSQRGWGLFAAVQHGITAMLAGQLSAALASFTQARMHVLLPHLAFLNRDACVKAAIVHALYGDSEQARALLNEADSLPRTESWAEPLVDASHTIAASVVRAQTPDEALRMLDSVPLNAVGEMWPFHLVAVQRALIGAQNHDEFRVRLAQYERTVTPRIDGEGFAGSSLLLCRALLAMAQGDLVEARASIERADQSIVATRVLLATLEQISGRPRVALQLVSGLHEETRGLRLLDRWRLAVIAGSHFALGSEDECREVLDFAMSLPDGVNAAEALYFPEPVRRYAEANLPDWPKTIDSHRGYDLFPMQRNALTARETDVLRELAKGLSREQIASAQFISMNTLKAHLRSIYRKFGVNSRAAAVLEGERRGIV